MRNVLYFVNHGVDTRHLIHCKCFKRLKHALIYLKDNMVSYTGNESAYSLQRHEYNNDRLQTLNNFKILKENII
jgi:hypothetical protein